MLFVLRNGILRELLDFISTKRECKSNISAFLVVQPALSGWKYTSSIFEK